MKFEHLSWGGNALGILLFIYLLTKSFNSPCFDLTDTYLSLGSLFVNVFVQFLAVTLKGEEN